MNAIKKHFPAKPFIWGLIAGILVMRILLTGSIVDLSALASHDAHYDANGEFHIHADFAAYINGQKLDLTAKKYMSAKNQVLAENVHLHDGKDNVIHFHAPGITLPVFFQSLGFTLTNDCFTTDQDKKYCTDDSHVLRLYVNRQPVQDLAHYVPKDADQLLLYYGAPDSPDITKELDSVTDEACIYTGSCPERGIAPPESCGLTCTI